MITDIQHFILFHWDQTYQSCCSVGDIGPQLSTYMEWSDSVCMRCSISLNLLIIAILLPFLYRCEKSCPQWNAWNASQCSVMFLCRPILCFYITIHNIVPLAIVTLRLPSWCKCVHGMWGVSWVCNSLGTGWGWQCVVVLLFFLCFIEKSV